MSKHKCHICGTLFESFRERNKHQNTCGTVKLSRFEGLESVENLRTLSPEESEGDDKTVNETKISDFTV